MGTAWNLERPNPIFVRRDDSAAVNSLRDLMMAAPIIALDTETTGLDISRCTVYSWSVSTERDNRFFLLRDCLPLFKDILEDPTRCWCNSQIKFDLHMLANSGINVTGNVFCTLTMDRLLDPNRAHGLKEAYAREFNERMSSFKQTFKKWWKNGRPLFHILDQAFREDPDRVIEYGSLDSWAVLRLFYRLKKQLKKTITSGGHSLWEIMLWHEVPFTRVLYQMERIGVQIDTEYMEGSIPIINEEIKQIQLDFHHRAGAHGYGFVNLGSRDSIARFFFGKQEYNEEYNPTMLDDAVEPDEDSDEGKKIREIRNRPLGLKPIKMTSGGKTGNRKAAVDEDVLKDLMRHDSAKVRELAEMVLNYRKLTKLTGTYITAIMGQVDRRGRIHTTFNQSNVETARLSSSDPNLQNQISPGAMRKITDFEIRQAFVAADGHSLIVADYDQLEMFLLAHFSGDEGMIANILAGRDIHTGNVELVWGEPYDEVMAAKKLADKVARAELDERVLFLLDLRRAIKTVGFGLNYGKGPNSLALELDYPSKIAAENPDWSEKRVNQAAKQMAQDLINVYFDRLPGVSNFIKETHRSASETGYVESYLGRRRYLPEICRDWRLRELHDMRQKENTGDQNALCWCEMCKASRGSERQAVNTIIQGSAADVAMLAMLRIEHTSRLREIGVKLLLQIHDEVVLECPNKYVGEAIPLVQECLEHPGVNLRVPLRAKPKAALNWLAAK